jgi:hypothetical protein
MGFYIETPKDKHKADQLIAAFGAIEVMNEPIQLPQCKYALVCVVENNSFDAAGLVYNEHELRRFADPTDRRPKRWLLMDRDLAYKLAGVR